jgi:Holliday junction resolvase RusA-like endonuclease
MMGDYAVAAYKWPAPHALPADSVEIVLDLPMPPSTNRIWRSGRGKVYRSAEYVRWAEQADMVVMAARAYPKRKIRGPFSIRIALSSKYGGDGDNRIKAVLDWLESRDVVRNDRDCREGEWKWVGDADAPSGCRVMMRSLHEPLA